MTAVEWFFNEIKHILPNDFLVKYKQAKEMEKEQIAKAIDDDFMDHIRRTTTMHELNKSE